jgi:predicted DNA-binding transcriptional regulator AlpA
MPEECMFTIDEFLRSHKISRGHFYNLMRRGEAPDTITLGARRLIPVEAAAAWRAKHLKRTKSEEG